MFRARSLILFLTLSFVLAVCGDGSFATDAPTPVPLRGTASAPSRIVSLVPSITETVFALGLGDSVVGISEQCDYPAEVAKLPRVGSFIAPVAESIVALRPDLVLTSPSPGNENAVRAMKRAGIRVEVVYGDGSVSEIRSTIERIAELVARPDEGAQLLASIDRDLETVRAAVAGKPSRSIAIVVGLDPLFLAGPDSYLGDLVSIAGGRNVADGIGGRWPRVGWEHLLAAAPEVLVDVSMEGAGPDGRDALLSKWSRYPSIPAVVAGRIFGHQSFLLLRPGPRIGQAARVIAEMLHDGGESGF